MATRRVQPRSALTERRAPPPAWFLPPVAEARHPGDVRLLTWNVHKGIGGLDRRYRPWRITEVIRFDQPDIVLLQEVADQIPRYRRDRQAESWRSALGFRYAAFLPTVRLAGGRWGSAVLSRYPILREERIDLSFPMKKRRAAHLVEIAVESRGRTWPLHLVNLHLGLSGVERRWQVRRLLEAPSLADLDRAARVVIAGDTNDWAGVLARPRGPLRQAGFETAWGRHHGSARTFPAWYPVAALDRVFLRGPIACRHAHRSHHALARRASDHLPVVVDLTVREH